MTIIVAAATVLPIALVLTGPPRVGVSLIAWSCIISKGPLSTFLATAAWQFGAARVGSASTGVFINIEPLIGAAIGILLFGDRMTVALTLGGLPIIGGNVVEVLGERGSHAAEGAESP